MFNPAFASEALHMILAAYAATSVLVLGVHTELYRRKSSPLHRAAIRLTLAFSIVAVPLLLFSGDRAAKNIAAHQPLKLAAAESLFHTTTEAPLMIGGLPDMETGEVRFAIEIPYALSILAFADPHAEVQGLDAFPEELWPPVIVVHFAFQIMVAAGMGMLALVLLGAFVWRRKGGPERSSLFLRTATLAAPLGVIAIEAGWTVTEVGRQPWIVQGVMRVRDAVTPIGGLWIHFTGFVSVYLGLGVVVIVLLRRHLLLSTTGARDDDGAANPSERDA
jgi:cytochrome d ubiquinol oxidase subunit I